MLHRQHQQGNGGVSPPLARAGNLSVSNWRNTVLKVSGLGKDHGGETPPLPCCR